METIYYTREAYAVLNTLIEAGHEMELNMLLEKANVNFLIAPTVLFGLLRGQEIVYRMENGVQFFRVNEDYHLPKPEEADYCPRDVDIYHSEISHHSSQESQRPDSPEADRARNHRRN